LEQLTFDLYYILYPILYTLQFALAPDLSKKNIFCLLFRWFVVHLRFQSIAVLIDESSLYEEELYGPNIQNNIIYEINKFKF
jgi:hypothetical protein